MAWAGLLLYNDYDNSSMAGGRRCSGTTWASRSSTSSRIWSWIVFLVSMETLVGVVVGAEGGANCSFTKDYLTIRGAKALELTCQCPEDQKNFDSLIRDGPIKIKSRNKSENDGQEIILYNPITKKSFLLNLEVVTDEQPGTVQGRAKLTLRLKNYTYDGQVEYVCYVEGRSSGQLVNKKYSLDPMEDFSTTTTTTTTTTAAIRTTVLALPTPLKDHTIRTGATSELTEESFSKVGLYTTVSLSCVLLIVIVLVIICFARVRARRKRENLDQNEDLENARAAAGRRRGSGECLTDDSTNMLLLTSRAKGQGNNACADHASSQSHRVRKLQRQTRETARRGEDVTRTAGEGRRGRLPPNDTPRRSRSRDTRSPRVAKHSRSVDMLDLGGFRQAGRRSHRSHRHSFSHDDDDNDNIDYYDDYEEFSASDRSRTTRKRHGGISEYARRSRSQPALQRHFRGTDRHASSSGGGTDSETEARGAVGFPVGRRGHQRHAGTYTTSMPRTKRHNLSHPHLSYTADGGDEPRGQYTDCPSSDSEGSYAQHLRTNRRGQPPNSAAERRDAGSGGENRRRKRRRMGRSGSLDSISDDVRRGGPPPRHGPRQLIQTPAEEDRGRECEMNSLSRDNVSASPSRRAPPLLNVPHEQPTTATRGGGPVAAAATAPTRRTAAATSSAAGQQPRRHHHSGSQQGRRILVEAEVTVERDPTVQFAAAPNRSGGSAEGDMMAFSGSSSSDDNLRGATAPDSKAHRAGKDFNLRNIKSDNETLPKRPVSVKVANNSRRTPTTTTTNYNAAQRSPIACDVDVAIESQGQGAGAAAHRRSTSTQSGIQRRESGRSGPLPSSHGASRCGRGGGGGQEADLRGLGLIVANPSSSLDPMLRQLSVFSESNHNTSVKTPHFQHHDITDA